MPSFFETLSNIFSKPAPLPFQKDCKNCFYSEYQGVICKLNTAPRKLLSRAEANLCSGYTVIAPSYDSQTHSAVTELPKEVDYELTPTSLLDDYTEISRTTALLAELKTFSLIILSNRLPTLLNVDYWCNGGSGHVINVTVQTNLAAETIVFSKSFDNTAPAVQQIELTSYQNAATIIIRVYLQGTGVLSAFSQMLQIIGDVKTKVVYK